jgi:rubrerythrin
MTDKWDELISNILVIHRKMVLSDTNGVYQKDFDDACTALRAAIDEVVRERGGFQREVKAANGSLARAEQKFAELEAQLKEANEDAERLAISPEWYKVQTDLYRCPFCGNLTNGEPEHLAHTDDCPYALHLARVAKGKG